jgi:hypothetical protein
MTFEIALALLVRARARADLDDVVKTLCALASAAHALGQRERRDDSIDAAADLLRERRPPVLVSVDRS